MPVYEYICVCVCVCVWPYAAYSFVLYVIALYSADRTTPISSVTMSVASFHHLYSFSLSPVIISRDSKFFFSARMMNKNMITCSCSHNSFTTCWELASWEGIINCSNEAFHPNFWLNSRTISVISLKTSNENRGLRLTSC